MPKSKHGMTDKEINALVKDLQAHGVNAQDFQAAYSEEKIDTVRKLFAAEKNARASIAGSNKHEQEYQQKLDQERSALGGKEACLASETRAPSVNWIGGKHGPVPSPKSDVKPTVETLGFLEGKLQEWKTAAKTAYDHLKGYVTQKNDLLNNFDDYTAHGGRDVKTVGDTAGETYAKRQIRDLIKPEAHVEGADLAAVAKALASVPKPKANTHGQGVH